MDALFDDSVSAVSDLLTQVIHIDIIAVRSGKFLRLDHPLRSRLVEGSTEDSFTDAYLLLSSMIHPTVEEGESLIHIILLVLKLLIPESLPILLELSSEGVLGAARIVYEGTILGLVTTS